MAKAKPITDLTADDAYSEAAAKIVEVRGGELFEHADGVLDTGDIERVHDMRVATRRLRAVLEIFAPCFPAKAHRGVLRDVKRLAHSLGERRDPDVQLEALAEYARRAAAADQRGIESLVEHFRELQAAGNVELAGALEKIERRELRARLSALVEETLI